MNITDLSNQRLKNLNTELINIRRIANQPRKGKDWPKKSSYKLLLKMMNLMKKLSIWSRSIMHLSRGWGQAKKTLTISKRTSCKKAQAEGEDKRLHTIIGRVGLVDQRPISTKTVAHNLMMRRRKKNMIKEDIWVDTTKTWQIVDQSQPKTLNKNSIFKLFEMMIESLRIKVDLSTVKGSPKSQIQLEEEACQTMQWWIATRSMGKINWMTQILKWSRKKQFTTPTREEEEELHLLVISCPQNPGESPQWMRCQMKFSFLESKLSNPTKW